jgi:hypothetical protein
MRYLMGFALLLPMIVFAKDPPLPETLINAKTAFVLNQGATDKDFDKLCKELKKWGRFSLVQDPSSSADILISLTVIFVVEGVGPTVSTISIDPAPRISLGLNQYLANVVRIVDGWGLLYSDATAEHSKNPRILVSNLKRKMKGK